MIRLRFGSTLAVSLLLAAMPSLAHAQAIVDEATTADQKTVGAVFDSKGAAATPGSSLDTDYNRILSGTSAQVSESAQSLLPTTAYGMAGAANALASTEERNVMGRLRTLRHSAALTPDRATISKRAPVVYPMQETGDSLHDLRGEKKSPTLTSPHGTTNNYRSYYPALYKDTADGSDRELVKSHPRTAPNMVDRATTSTLNLAGKVGGQGQAFATEKDGLPRRVAQTMRDSDTAAATPKFRGQPLAGVSAVDQPLPIQSVSNTPMQLSPSAQKPIQLTSAPPLTVMQSPYDPMNPPPPVIYGPNDPIPDQQAPTSAAPAPQKKAPFVYKKIDQSEGLTTPQLGSPSTSRTTLSIRQNNALALASSPDTNIKVRVPTRRTTETGAFLWTDEEGRPSASEASQPETRTRTATFSNQSISETDSNAAIAYGTQAIPLRETGSINADRRWGFFLTGTTGFGSDELQADSDKTKTVTAGFTTGADYRIADKSYVGLALTYVHSSFTTGNYGDLQSNSTALSLYGTTDYATHGYVDGYISAGYLNMDSERTVFAGAGTTRRANGSPDGFQFSGKAETGYDIKQDSLTYGPFAGFRLAYADFGSFTEKDASNFNLKVHGFNNLSAIGTLGVGGSHRYVMSTGGVLMPSMRMGYNHEFGDDRSNIKAEFVNLANSSFTTKSDKKSRDWISLSPSVTASLPNDWTVVAQYEHDFFRDDVNENIFNLAAHYAW